LLQYLKAWSTALGACRLAGPCASAAAASQDQALAVAADFLSKAANTTSWPLACAAVTDVTGAFIGAATVLAADVTVAIVVPATAPAVPGPAVTVDAVAALPNDTGAMEKLGSRSNVPPAPTLSDVPVGKAPAAVATSVPLETTVPPG